MRAAVFASVFLAACSRDADPAANETPEATPAVEDGETEPSDTGSNPLPLLDATTHDDGTLVDAHDDGTVFVPADGCTAVDASAGGAPDALADAVTGGSGSWSTAAPMVSGRVYHVQLQLPDGRVFVGGGSGRNDDPSAYYGGPMHTTAVYDPALDRWTAGPRGPSDFAVFAGTLVNGRPVLHGKRGMTTVAYSVDVAFGLFDVAAPLQHDVNNATFATLSDGSTAALSIDVAAKVAIVQRYDPVLDAWSDLPKPSLPREGAQVLALEGGRLLLFGGAAAPEVLDVAKKTWTTLPADPAAATWYGYQGVVTKAKDRVLVTGQLSYGTTTSLSIFDPACGTYTPGPWFPTTPGDVVLLADGRLLATGGVVPYHSSRLPPVATGLFDPETGAWSLTAPPPNAEGGSAVTRLADGRVMLSGGSHTCGKMCTAYSSAVYLFTP